MNRSLVKVIRYIILVVSVASVGCSPINKIPKDFQEETTGVTANQKYNNSSGRSAKVIGRLFEFEVNGKKYESVMSDPEIPRGEKYKVIYDRRDPAIHNILYNTQAIEEDKPLGYAVGRVLLVYPKDIDFHPVAYYEYSYPCTDPPKGSDSCTNTRNYFMPDDYEKLYPNLKPGNTYEVRYSLFDPRMAILNLNKPIHELSAASSDEFLKQRRRSDGRFLFDVGGGYNYSDNRTLTDWARSKAGTKIGSPYNNANYFDVSMAGLKKRFYFELGFNVNGNHQKTCLAINSAAGYALCENVNLVLLAKINAGYQLLEMNDNITPGTYQYYYRQNALYAGPSVKALLFPKTKTRNNFIGIEAGLNYIYSNFNWDHGYKAGYSKYSPTYYSKAPGVPNPANAIFFVRLSIGFAE